jgi:8-oxo-dGTP diphosphatase
MSDANTPTFGRAPAGVTPVVRPSAYAIVPGDEGRLALVRTTKGWFLPGGGIEPGESPADAVVREAREECGLALEPGQELGRAREIVRSEAEDTWFEKRSTFVLAAVAAAGLDCTEDDHALTWLAPAAAVGALVHESHRWAVERWLARGAEVD